MFILKKMLGSLLMPLPFCLFISFLGVFLLWRGRKVFAGKMLVTAGLVGLTVMSYNPVSRALNTPLTCQYRAYSPHRPGAAPSKPLPYVVVLAGGHESDPNIPVTGQLSGTSMIRLMEGIRILRLNPGAKLILSGGALVDPVPEGGIMADVSRFMGVPEGDIIVEPASRDTKEQARRIRPIVGAAPFVLVTSAVHLPRSMALFEKLGMNPIPGPAGSTSRVKTPFSFQDVFPSVDALEDATHALHEYFGILWGRLRGQI